MKIGAIILVAAALVGAGVAAGVWFTTKASGGRIEELAGGKAQAEGERDIAVQVSEDTVSAAISMLGEQSHVAEVIASGEKRARGLAAEEAQIAKSIRRALPEDRGQVPKVVADAVRALYEAQAAREAAP